MSQLLGRFGFKKMSQKQVFYPFTIAIPSCYMGLSVEHG